MARRLYAFLRRGVRLAFSRDGLDELQFVVAFVLLGWLLDGLSPYLRWDQALRILVAWFDSTPDPGLVVGTESGPEFGLVVPCFMLVLWLLGLHRWMRRVGLFFLTGVSLLLVGILLLMAATLVGRTDGTYLLIDGAIMWLLVWLYFAFWYWQVDRGGPNARNRETGARWEIVFSQQADHYPGWEAWRPALTDYLLLALSTSLTLSPSEGTVMLSLRMKWLLMIHMLTAATVLILIAGRALNIAG